MTTSPIDPNRLSLTGENPYIYGEGRELRHVCYG